MALDRLSRRLCHRHTGIGGDGVIYYAMAPDGTAQMRLVNADGSPSELSGNGLRCLAALVDAFARAITGAAVDAGSRQHRRWLEDAGADRPEQESFHLSRRHGAA